MKIKPETISLTEYYKLKEQLTYSLPCRKCFQNDDDYHLYPQNLNCYQCHEAFFLLLSFSEAMTSKTTSFVSHGRGKGRKDSHTPCLQWGKVRRLNLSPWILSCENFRKIICSQLGGEYSHLTFSRQNLSRKNSLSRKKHGPMQA